MCVTVYRIIYFENKNFDVANDYFSPYTFLVFRSTKVAQIIYKFRNVVNSFLNIDGIQYGTSNAYSSVLRNVANIATITLSLITTHVRTISRVKTLKHQTPRVKRHRNIGNDEWGLKKATVAPLY